MDLLGVRVQETSGPAPITLGAATLYYSGPLHSSLSWPARGHRWCSVPLINQHVVQSPLCLQEDKLVQLTSEAVTGSTEESSKLGTIQAQYWEVAVFRQLLQGGWFY